MASTTANGAGIAALSRDEARDRQHTLPWYLWCSTAAVTSAIVGVLWDISWHQSIGRDTFWTPAHLAIYMCGVLAGLAYGYVILSTTFTKHAPLADCSVHILGLRAPLGAFIASWGGVAMLTSAPFDNWWHDAYGLDVKILSPPHIVLFIGIYSILIGTLVLIAGHMNRATGADRLGFRRMFLYVGGMALTGATTVILELTTRTRLHDSLPYIDVGAIVPPLLVVMSRATGTRWAATVVTGFYTLLLIGLIQILPLFPAEPKLGPVYQHVTHFIPPGFPLLLVVPALVLDLFWARTKHWNGWALSVLSAVLFVGSFLAVEYPFATFLMSPASRNAFFGTAYFPYAAPPMSYLVRSQFYLADTSREFWTGIGMAVLFSTLTVRFGISRGDWMSKVKR
jgi:hypothetical protein